MASARLSASILVASLILVLCWTTSSAQSRDRGSTDAKQDADLVFRTREKVAASLTVSKDILTVVKEVIGKKEIKMLSDVMKGFANFASLAPGIGGLVFSVVNVALAFIPQENPLKELKEQFAEVNRKLDSLSIQISNLATDVEWFNYVSVYSQDELRILNAWRKFDEFRENSELVENEEEKLRLAEIFTNYYENTGTEASVSNFYHYLTVNSTSLSENLNTLLEKKFKCDIREIGQYNFYFSSLLWKGMVLNRLYWRLIGLNSPNKDTEHVEMFKKVYTAQVSAVNYCLDNINDYIDQDVVETSKSFGYSSKRRLAAHLEEKLDEKYFWYKWVVLVYGSYNAEYHKLHKMREISVDTINVAVSPTQKEKPRSVAEVKKEVDSCYEKVLVDLESMGIILARNATSCDFIYQTLRRCSVDGARYPDRELVKVMFESYYSDFGLAPDPLQARSCTLNTYNSKIYIYSSKSLPACDPNPCQNGGTCRRLLDSNDHLCDCPYGWLGNQCEKKLETRTLPADLQQNVPGLSTINIKLKEILSILQNRRQR